MDIVDKTQKEKESRVAEEYYSSLSDLNCNSKPLINMLTMLAEENIEYASVIVKVVADHITKVPPDIKLPILYLIDSIVKNVKNTYVQLFSQCIVSIFCDVFEKVNEKVRERMYALRQTWNEVFSIHKLYTLDVKVKRMDNNWPITAKQPQPSIHVNPNFLKVNSTQSMPSDMEEILHVKTRELLELKKRKLELELEATKKHLEEQEKQLSKTSDNVIPPIDVLVSDNQPLETVPESQRVPPARMIKGMENSNIVTPQKTLPLHPSAATALSGSGIAIRPGMYSNNFRNSRPQQMSHAVPPRMLNNIGYPNAQSGGKSKVNPVDSLLGSVHHRDPRLIRQLQNQQFQSTQLLQSDHSDDALTARNLSVSSENSKNDNKKSLSYRNNNNSNNNNSNKSNRTNGSRHSSKSPTRHSSFRSSGRSNKSCSSRIDKDRNRKRSESKSSTTSSSSATSNSSFGSRKKCLPNSLTQLNRDFIEEYDKDAFEIVPLSEFKNKPLSPVIPPIKAIKESSKSPKESSKSRNSQRSKNNLRNSLTENVSKDTDLRKMSPAAELDPNILEKHAILLDMDQDMEDIHKTNSTPKELDKTSNYGSMSAPNFVSKPKNIRSFAITKDDSYGRGNNANIIYGSKTIKGDDEDGKKRVSIEADTSEPMSKKSKSSKLDALFGTEDVDLRTEMSPQLVNAQNILKSDDSKRNAPILSDKVGEMELNRENILHKKSGKAKLVSDIKEETQKKLPHLDDVRAKLAKAASKTKKNEEFNEHKRPKFNKLNISEDTQEANDEKLRTIISQAQELLDANSITQHQYKNLVQTVMSINESNKLEEAKRRESLNSLATKTITENGSELDINNSETNRRDAVLKKRIPKLPKNVTINSNDVKCNELSLVDNRNTENYYEENIQSNEVSNEYTKLNTSDKKENHQKAKWNDRQIAVITHIPITSIGGGITATAVTDTRPWLQGINNKHSRGMFRHNIPLPPMPPMSNHNLHLSQMPWQMSSGGIEPAAFLNSMGAHIHRSNVPVMQQSPLQQLNTKLPKPCNSIDNPQADLVRTITVDGLAKEIRIYDQIAIVFMELDQPREIGFQEGKRSIIIDNQEPITLQFNDDYRSFPIAGEPHRLRFGFPSRELYIDENWYEIYFGGPPVSIPIGNKIHILKAEGPPPQVNIGPLRRDLVLGKITMIIDAHIMVHLFLDARIQTFRLNEKEHTIQFADNLGTVLLDNRPVEVEYGGLPRSVTLGDKKYFIRFSTLPQGVEVGKVRIANMAYVNIRPECIDDIKTEGMNFKFNSTKNTTIVSSIEAPVKDASFLEIKSLKNDKIEILESSDASSSTSNAVPRNVLNNINIDELLQKLVSKGILPNATKNVGDAKISTTVGVEESVPIIVSIAPIDLSKVETIKTRQVPIVTTLFSGMQCSSCGVRFPPEQTIKYSQHLDWHFRQNRRERDSTRKAHSRRWYYDINDWVLYEEFEDLEEREKNFFESQQNDLDSNDEVSNQQSTHPPVLSCPAGLDDVDRTCYMCNEKFEQFYNEELEEWHLRPALRVEDKIYHPICYDDFKASIKLSGTSIESSEKDKEILDGSDDNAMDIIIKVETNRNDNTLIGNNDISDDDDDDVIVLPNEEPSVTEIDDDDEVYEPFNATGEGINAVKNLKDDNKDLNDATESDVEIQEPHIPFTDLDTYIEKQLPETDNGYKIAFTNIKIKEEPKDDDNDDDFEDVGTVLVTPDEEISVQSSSEDPRIQAIDSSISAVSPPTVENASTRMDEYSVPVDMIKSINENNSNNLNVNKASLDDDLVTEGEHNLSTVRPAPTIPLASLVNKIKINITKNVTTMPSAHNASIEHSQSNNTESVSTIPVLCGGTASGSSMVPMSVTALSDTLTSNTSTGLKPSVSSITVIGASYGNISNSSCYHPSQINVVKPLCQQTPSPVTSTASLIEETIRYALKDTLQNVTLQKIKKIECGTETSGLCSIM